MDYKTKPITRRNIRLIAIFVRKHLFKCKNKYYFDVISALEILPKKLHNVTYEILSDDDPELNNIPATTVSDMEGNYCIKIKESVYEGAYFKKIGGYRNHVMHEISHVILFSLGFTPYFDRTYNNYQLKNYESIEWQAKALAGEILIPYKETQGMTVKSIMKKCKVSKPAAEKRVSFN